MSWLEIIVLALIQGVTEFLPVSSSAHLILPSEVLGWQDQGLAFDVAVHVGTLFAVMWFYRQRIFSMLSDNLVWAVNFKSPDNIMTPNAKLMWFIGLGTIPAGVFGLLGGDWIEENLRSILVIAIATLVFGLLLGMSDKTAKEIKQSDGMSIKDILIIGFAQALALIPGTSRSGITMTAALFLGFKREDAANVSFLLSIPLILSAGALKTVELIHSDIVVDWVAIIAGSAIAFIFAYCSIALFLKLLNKIGMMPFVVYRIVLAIILFAIVFAL